MAKNPQASAQKWANNLSAATTAIQQGVAGVTVSPTAKAAQMIQAQVAGVQRAAASGKTQRALEAVTLQQWQNAMTTKGVPRIATGAAAALPKFQNFLNQLIPYQQAGMNQLPPRGDINQNIQRMVAWTQYMSGFKKQ
jgi:hypothetical protein